MANQKYYFKITGNNLGNYPYRIGLNTLKHNDETFNTEMMCGPGGLYFTTAKNIFGFVYCGHELCIITLPKDAQVVQVINKIKSDKIIIEKKMLLWDGKTLDYLVSMGADANVDDSFVVRWACLHGYLFILQRLIEEMNATIHKYALACAAYNGHLDIVRYLVSMGADINAEQERALHAAATCGHLNVVEYIFSIGVKVLYLDIIESAYEYGHMDIVQFIFSKLLFWKKCIVRTRLFVFCKFDSKTLEKEIPRLIRYACIL